MWEVMEWLEDPRRMSDDAAARMRKLAGLLSGTRRPLYHRYTTEPLRPGETSILDLLRADPWEIERIRTLLSDAREATEKRLKKQAPRSQQQSGEDGDEILMDNLRSLGVV